MAGTSPAKEFSGKAKIPVASLVPANHVFGSGAPLFLLFLQEINSGR